MDYSWKKGVIIRPEKGVISVGSFLKKLLLLKCLCMNTYINLPQILHLNEIFMKASFL